MNTKQYSYTIDKVGRIHIRVDNNLVTGIIIDDTKDFYYDRSKYPIVEDDYIIKIGIEIIKYCTNKTFNLFTIPISMELTDFSSKFIDKVMSIPYGETSKLDDLVTKGQRSHALKLINNFQLQIAIPIHRVIDDKIDKDLSYYFEKLRLLEFKNGKLCI